MVVNSKFYQYGLPQPYHISVGAVVFNDQYEICLHHFFKDKVPERLHFLSDGLDEIWHLVRESLEGDESLQAAVLRGVQEEFGITGRVEKYLGAKIDVITGPQKIHPFEKLTVYHAVRAIEYGERPDIDEESRTVMEWHSPAQAREIYRQQASLTTRPELDETIIIDRFIEAYQLPY